MSSGRLWRGWPSLKLGDARARIELRGPLQRLTEQAGKSGQTSVTILEPDLHSSWFGEQTAGLLSQISSRRRQAATDYEERQYSFPSCHPTTFPAQGLLSNRSSALNVPQTIHTKDLSTSTVVLVCRRKGRVKAQPALTPGVTRVQPVACRPPVGGNGEVVSSRHMDSAPLSLTRRCFVV